MDDGSATPERFYFNTHSFSYEEQIILQRILYQKFNILCSIHKHGIQFKLYVIAQSLNLFVFFEKILRKNFLKHTEIESIVNTCNFSYCTPC